MHGAAACHHAHLGAGAARAAAQRDGHSVAKDVQAWFGTIGASMQTLFTVMTLSGWHEIMAAISLEVPVYVVFPLTMFYIISTSYAMMSLITGIIRHPEDPP